MKKVLALVLILMLIPLAAFADSNRIFDNAGLFGNADIIKIDAVIKSMQEQTQLDFAILTTDDFLGEGNQKAIADSFYDTQGFGLDSVHSGMLFYIDMNQRMQYISTTGNLINILNDENIERALDVSTPYMTKGNYTDAVIAIIEFVMVTSTAYWKDIFTPSAPTN